MQGDLTGDRLRALAREHKAAMEGALYEWANVLMGERMKPVTPVDTGALRDSGLVDEPVSTVSGVKVTLGFGGVAAPYAIYVHEDLEARHSPGTGAKFVERPLHEAEPHMSAEVGALFAARVGM